MQAEKYFKGIYVEMPRERNVNVNMYNTLLAVFSSVEHSGKISPELFQTVKNAIRKANRYINESTGGKYGRYSIDSKTNRPDRGRQ
jgi:hypothetical protein